MHRAGGISDLAYLRILQLVHSQTSALVDDLKSYELPNSTTPRTPLEATEFRRSLPGAALSTGSTTAIGAMLDNALEELFMPYTEGQRYLERENKNLGTLYSTLLASFHRYHVSPRKLVRVRSLIKFRSGENT